MLSSVSSAAGQANREANASGELDVGELRFLKTAALFGVGSSLSHGLSCAQDPRRRVGAPPRQFRVQDEGGRTLLTNRP